MAAAAANRIISIAAITAIAPVACRVAADGRSVHGQYPRVVKAAAIEAKENQVPRITGPGAIFHETRIAAAAEVGNHSHASAQCPTRNGGIVVDVLWDGIGKGDAAGGDGVIGNVPGVESAAEIVSDGRVGDARGGSRG